MKLIALKSPIYMVLTFIMFSSYWSNTIYAEYGDVVINNFSDSSKVRPAVFPHWFHRKLFTCNVCHLDLEFQMKAGSNKINMREITKGKFCGECHNGKIAWSVLNCQKCHTGNAGSPTGVHQEVANGEPSAHPAIEPLLPPTEDGIHDPDFKGTQQLKSPADGLGNLSMSELDGFVDWVAAIQGQQITPRSHKTDEEFDLPFFPLTIERKVQGSMPDVLFPHDKHTQWLACGNCHPDVFIPQAGANEMNMDLIMQGKSCGTCHGKVAFPIIRCFTCHAGEVSD